MSTRSIPNLVPTNDYIVAKTMSGLTVKFKCQACTVDLVCDLISEAGVVKTCPGCNANFICPGVNEKDAELQRRRDVIAQREALSAQKRAAADAELTRKVALEAKKHRDLNRDPLKEWVIYASVIACLIAVGAGTHLIAAVLTDRSGISIAIFGLFGVAILVNLRSVRSLRDEFACAATVVRTLDKKSGFQELLDAPPAGVFHHHVIDLYNISRHDPSVSQDSLVTLLYSRLMARSKIVSVLSSVLVSLGLIGTIVGLISMTNGLSGPLESLGESGDASSLLSGMRETMKGLGTAFYTTLVVAILGSVVLKVLNSVYTSNVDHFVSYIAGVTEVRITPALRKRSRKKSKSGVHP